MPPYPLHQLDEHGRPYRRPQAIEEAVEVALSQPLDVVLRRATIRRRTDPEYLPSECLVHLVRAAARAVPRDARRFNPLVDALLARCAGIFEKKLRGLEAREQALNAIVDRLVRDGHGHSPHRLDFFEARFDMAIKFLILDVIRKVGRMQVHEELDEATPDNDLATIVEGRGIIKDALTSTVSRRGVRWLKEALEQLPDVERQALVLVYLDGLQIASKNPDLETATTICKVSERAIRDRISRAIAKLKQLENMS